MADVLQDAYGGAGVTTQPTPTHTHGSDLPFTGMDIGLLAGGGLLLVVIGTALRAQASRT